MRSISEPLSHPVVDESRLDGDVFHSLAAILSHERAQGLYRTRRKLGSAQGAHVRWRGRDYLNFSSNDYLNLAADARLARAAARAARRYGAGAGASPLVSGYLPPLRALECALARREGAEAALVCGGGLAAHLPMVSPMASTHDDT